MYFSLAALLVLLSTVSAMVRPIRRADQHAVNSHVVRNVTATRQTSRKDLLARLTRPSRTRRDPSAAPFPPSTWPGYTSTGNVPWALYTTQDIAATQNVEYHNEIQSVNSCNDLCQGTNKCVGSTFRAQPPVGCFVFSEIDSYFSPSVNGYVAFVRGLTCAQNEAIGRGQWASGTNGQSVC